jgi:hypothetical protein
MPETADEPNHQLECSYTITDFCVAERMSRSKFYDLKRQGLAPQMMSIGGLWRISPSARRRWHSEREEAARAAAALSTKREGGE